MTKNNKLEFINFLYVIGALLVVLGHSTANYLGNWGAPNLLESNSAIIVHDYIYTFHMPLFFAISGYVYKFNLDKGKYKDFIPFVSQKARRLLVPYIIIGLFYVSPIKLVLGDYTINNFLKSILINIGLAAGPSQLWYLFSLFNIFVIFYFLNKYFFSGNNKRRNHLIFLLIFVSFTTFINTGLSVFQIEATLNNLLFFHIGYLLCNFQSEHANVGIKTVMFLCLHLLTFILSLYFVIPLLDFVLTLLGLTAYYFLAIWATKTFKNLNNHSSYTTLRKYNLEIYLYHQQLIQLLLLSKSFRLLPPWINIAITFIFSIAISITIGYIINNIKKTNQKRVEVS